MSEITLAREKRRVSALHTLKGATLTINRVVKYSISLVGANAKERRRIVADSNTDLVYLCNQLILLGEQVQGI